MKLNSEKLEFFMAEKGLKIKDLSQKTGIHKATISKIKNGVQKARPITIGKLAKALEINLIELLETEN